jgi:hypothetical protein
MGFMAREVVLRIGVYHLEEIFYVSGIERFDWDEPVRTAAIFCFSVLISIIDKFAQSEHLDNESRTLSRILFVEGGSVAASNAPPSKKSTN